MESPQFRTRPIIGLITIIFVQKNITCFKHQEPGKTPELWQFRPQRQAGARNIVCEKSENKQKNTGKQTVMNKKEHRILEDQPFQTRSRLQIANLATATSRGHLNRRLKMILPVTLTEPLITIPTWPTTSAASGASASSNRRPMANELVLSGLI